MSGLVLRPAEPADQRRLIEICIAAQRQAFPGWPSDMATPADFEAQTRDEELWVALFGNRPAGMAAILCQAHFLHHLYVDPAAQGQGAGKALLGRVLQQTGGRLSLKCDVENRRACAFYQAMGFQPREWGWAPTGPWVRFAR